MTDAATPAIPGPKRDLKAMIALALANRAINFPVPPHVQEQLDAEKVDLEALEKEAAAKAKADAKAAKAAGKGAQTDPSTAPGDAAGGANSKES